MQRNKKVWPIHRTGEKINRTIPEEAQTLESGDRDLKSTKITKTLWLDIYTT